MILIAIPQILGFANSTTVELAPLEVENGTKIASNLKELSTLLYSKGNDDAVIRLIERVDPDFRLLSDDFGIAWFGDLPIHMITRSATRGNISLETFKKAITTLASRSIDSLEVHINQKTYSSSDRFDYSGEFCLDGTGLHLIASYDDLSDWDESDLTDEQVVEHLVKMAEFLISIGADKSETDGSDFIAYELVADDPIFYPLREALKLN